MLLCYSAIPSRSLRSAYQLMISSGDVPHGVYVFKLTQGSNTQTIKSTL